MLGRATSNMDTQDSPQPGLRGSHHLPPYNILWTSPQGPHPNGFSRGSPEIVPMGTPTTLEPYNFASRPRLEVRSEAKLYFSSKAFQQYVARHLQPNKSGRFLTFFLSDSLTPDLSFGYNLCFRCPNEQCEPILDIYVPRAFQ